jgi:hypothetical protein
LPTLSGPMQADGAYMLMSGHCRASRPRRNRQMKQSLIRMLTKLIRPA